MLARNKNMPTAQVMRQALSDCAKKQKKQTAAEAFAGLAKSAFKGPGDLSTRHDDYLYGGK